MSVVRPDRDAPSGVREATQTDGSVPRTVEARTEDNSQQPDQLAFWEAKMSEWGVRRARELKAEGRLGGPSTDPFLFWCRPARQTAARWARDIWVTVLGSPRRIHTRRIHYALLGSGIIPPWRFNTGRRRKDGTHARHDEAYAEINASSDYGQLIGAIRDARYAGLIDAELIEDHRNPDIQWAGEKAFESLSPYCRAGSYAGPFSVDGEVEDTSAVRTSLIPSWEPLVDRRINFESPMFGSSLIGYDDTDGLYHAMHPYRLAIISEKSGVNDAVESALQRLRVRVDYLEMVGNASLTRVLDYVRGIHEKYPGKEIVLFYLSDYDKAGKNMPREFAQKLRYDLERRALLNGSVIPSVKVYQLALTEAQVRRYDLPHAPESRDPKSAKYELDALIQLHPEALQGIIMDAMSRYHDANLRERCGEAVVAYRNAWLDRAREPLEAAEDEVHDIYNEFAGDLESAWRNYQEQAEKHQTSIQNYNQRLKFTLDDDVVQELKDSFGVESRARIIAPPACPLVDEIQPVNLKPKERDQGGDAPGSRGQQ